MQSDGVDRGTGSADGGRAPDEHAVAVRRSGFGVRAALADVAQDVILLDLGKPNVTVHEMLAWLRSAHHRENSSAHVNSIVIIGDARIDLVAMTVATSTGQRIRLTPTEWQLLEELLRHLGELVRRDTLLTVLRGGADYVDPSYLRVYMAQLRRKLEPEPGRPRHLVTEPGMGYRFQQ